MADILLVTSLHGRLLNHMTIITEVGVSYVDHTNDDASEVDSFSGRCYQALSPPPLPLVFEVRS